MNKICRKKEILYILGGLFMIVIAYWPNFHPGLYEGSDLSFHLNRIDSLAESLRNGVFPVKLHATRAFGYGYGVGFFYCNFFLYIPALLMNFGMSLLTSYKVFLFLGYIAMFAAMGFAVFKLTNSVEVSFIISSMYVISGKVMGVICYDSGTSEFVALIFIPLAVVGMYIFMVYDEKPYMLIAGFSGLILAHTISTFLTFVACGFIVIFYLKKLFINKEKVIHLISAVLCVSVLTMGFWLPMFEQMLAQDLKVNHPWTASEENVESLINIVQGERGLGEFVSLIYILSVVGFVVLLIKKGKSIIHKILPVMLIATGMTFVSTWWWWWHFINSILGIQFLQFPFRLFSSATVLILLVFALIYVEFEEKNVKRFATLCMLCFGVYMSFQTYLEDKETMIGYKEVNAVVEGMYAGLGAGEEWLPVETDREELIDSTKAYDNEGNEIKGEKLEGYNKFVFEADMRKQYYDIPYIWYKGYVAEDSEGNSLNITKNENTGMVRVHISENSDSEELITVYYSGTLCQKLAYVGSVFGICVVVLQIVMNKKLKERGLRNDKVLE